MQQKISYDTIDNLRKSMGTCPEQKPIIKTNFKLLKREVSVTLEDHMSNPYKSMFVTATSTWGDNEFKQKWPITHPEGKLEVIKAVLTHNTLPQAREMVQFIFRVRGVPRWLFDYHTQVPFTSFMSIGCRDNNKSDVDIITINEINDKEKLLFRQLKDLYVETLGDNQSSWQSARSFLPQSYQHSYHFGQNLLSIISMRGFNACKKFKDDLYDSSLSLLYRHVVKSISDKFPLIGHYLNILYEDNEKVFNQIRNLSFKELSDSDKNLFKQN